MIFTNVVYPVSSHFFFQMPNAILDVFLTLWLFWSMYIKINYQIFKSSRPLNLETKKKYFLDLQWKIKMFKEDWHIP